MGTGICPFCGKKVDKVIMFRGDIIGCRYCGIHTKYTKADHIRAMTDEELAEWFIKIQNDISAYFTTRAEKAPQLPTQIHTWIDWLNREAEQEMHNGQ